MMEPVGTVWVSAHSRGLDVDISLHSDDNRPAVYAWSVDRTIIYIGKAGNGLKRQMAQHSDDFQNSVWERSHAEFLDRISAQGRIVHLHAMWPNPVEYMGYAIPSHLSVADWLIMSIEPKPVRNMTRMS